MSVYSLNDNLFSVILFLCVISILKILSTIFTNSTGCASGFFAPSLFIGAILGIIVGLLTEYYFGISVSYLSYMVVGMAAFFAGITNTPLASSIMIIELTRSYHLRLPLMLVVILNFIFTKKINLYRNQYLNKFHTPAHMWSRTQSTLLDLSVSDVLLKKDIFLCIVDQSVKLEYLYHKMQTNRDTDFILVDSEDNSFRGIFSWNHISKDKHIHVITSGSLEKYSISPKLNIKKTTSLYEVLDILINYNLDKLPIFGTDENINIVKGYISFRDILDLYRNYIKMQRSNT